MIPASFASKPDSSPPSGLEGIRRNIADIGLNLPTPAAGSSLERASVLSQGLGEGLPLKFAGQASGMWVVNFSHLLIVANACGLRGGGALPWHSQISLEVTI